MKNLLPSHILENILRKEQLYNSFTAQELLDHIVSDNHNNRKPESYDVHKVANTPSRLRLTQEQTSLRKRDDMNRQRPAYRGKRSVPVLSNKTQDTNGRVMYPPGKNSLYFREKLDRLDMPALTCFLCLEKHAAFNCTKYTGSARALGTQLCKIRTAQGKIVPHGFHLRQNCHDKANQVTTARPGEKLTNRPVGTHRVSVDDE